MATVSIPLTQGKFALIDEGDYDLVSQYRWQVKRTPSGKLYAQTSLPRRHPSGLRTLPLHRLILSAPVGIDVDHENGDGLDNRRSNIRLATRSQNAINRDKPPGGTSRFKGVRLIAKSGRWRASICKQGRQIHIGNFRCEVEAAKRYDEVARQLYGPFARVNFPDEQKDALKASAASQGGAE
jgi:hypothetical protein